ncbi:MAG: TetR/AcrR family transcriptional regulator [Vulcanimicrobiota bacterium]
MSTWRFELTYHHGNLRAALLQAASDMVAESGPDALTLRAVARQAGVSQTAPYRHFADKEELLAEVAELGFERLKAWLMNSLEGEEDPVERLHAVGRGYLTYAMANPHLFRLMFGPLVAKGEAYPDLESTCKEGFEILLGVIREGQQAGCLAEGNVEAMGMAAWSMVHGLAHLTIDGQMLLEKASAANEEAMGRMMGTFLIEGLRRR